MSEHLFCYLQRRLQNISLNYPSTFVLIKLPLVRFVLYLQTMLTKSLCQPQDGDTPLHLAAEEGHTTCVEHLLSTPGIDVNIKNKVNRNVKKILGQAQCML